jgi:RND family efflux transporter MFP subunit
MSRIHFLEAALAAMLLASCGGETPRVAEQKFSGATAIAASATLPETRITTGTVRSTNISPLAAKVMGNVMRVLVNEGDHVRAGDLLLEIDDREMRAKSAQATAGADEVDQAIAAARANADVMAATYKRFTMLRDRGSVSAQEFDEVAAKNSAAQAQLRQAMAQRERARAGMNEADTFLSYSRVRAPISGVVTARMVDPGAQAAPGMPLLTIEDDARYRVETTVDEELAARIRAGDIVHVDGREARITNVVPAFDPTTRSALVRIELPRDSGLRSGAFVHVAFTAGTRNGITVPATAVQRRGQLTSVSVIDSGGLARMRLVTLGEPAGEAIEVLSGIDAGERVALP